ncbi:MAG: hypothetical protein CVU99_09835 [Firmicutes bacterium HGW-Firmicutes-4]|jgi:hypothetical protein|nr:MAG: hypothetical protein CVU99_09835 [Firmicutes bacterium HGW-Firmicutes-4]
MDNEKKGIYGNAEELVKKDRDLGSSKDPIYGEAEEAANKNRDDVRTFMADPDGHNPIVDKQIRYSPETPEQTDGVYTQAGELAEKEKALKDTDGGIYSEAEDLAKNNAADMHNFMADSDGKE